MKSSLSDFQLMRLSISAISVSAILSGIILYGSQQYADHAQKDYLAAQRQMNDARSRLTAARQDQENMSAYSAEYGLLGEQDVIGDDHRLDWIEGLEKLRRQDLVIDFRYNIAPQKIYAPLPAIDSGAFNIHYSEMKLQFDLLHEGQLLKFFDALRNQTKGHYQLEGCTLQHTGTAGNEAASTATHINAECSGGWITLKNRNSPQ
jgi:hypothetical protein